jgi:hypothetical protein
VATGGGGTTGAGGGVGGVITGGGGCGGGVEVSALPVSFMSCINAARAAAWAGVSSARVEKVVAQRAITAMAGKSLGVCIKYLPNFLRQIFLKRNSFCRK